MTADDDEDAASDDARSHLCLVYDWVTPYQGLTITGVQHGDDSTSTSTESMETAEQ